MGFGPSPRGCLAGQVHLEPSDTSDMAFVISDFLPLMQGLIITLRHYQRWLTRTPPANPCADKGKGGPERVAAEPEITSRGQYSLLSGLRQRNCPKKCFGI